MSTKRLSSSRASFHGLRPRYERSTTAAIARPSISLPMTAAAANQCRPLSASRWPPRPARTSRKGEDSSGHFCALFPAAATGSQRDLAVFVDLVPSARTRRRWEAERAYADQGATSKVPQFVQLGPSKAQRVPALAAQATLEKTRAGDALARQGDLPYMFRTV